MNSVGAYIGHDNIELRTNPPRIQRVAGVMGGTTRAAQDQTMTSSWNNALFSFLDTCLVAFLVKLIGADVLVAVKTVCHGTAPFQYAESLFAALTVVKSMAGLPYRHLQGDVD